MNIHYNSPRPFSVHLPIYNWLYPTFTEKVSSLKYANDSLFTRYLTNEPIKARSLYFHIPFCDTICSFCPFVKAGYKTEEAVDRYVNALINEIRHKGTFSKLTEIPIEVIFFGGGTPSLLTAQQIERIGKEIHNTFDTSHLREFSFEVEVKSITEDKLFAMRNIGVTHGRFGLQTFNQKYRDLFSLTATHDHIYKAIELLQKHLPFNSFDIIYGMNGQTDQEFISDVELAANTGFRNIDFYPLNNYVSQIRLHKAFAKNNLHLNDPFRKLDLNIMLRNKMKSLGYLPHNGHGFVKASNEELASNPVLSDNYTFHYHKHVYGLEDRDILGFGASAISTLNNYTIINSPERDTYTSSLTDGNLNYSIGKHEPNSKFEKGVSMHLPYFGVLNKSSIHWDKISDSIKSSLEYLIDLELVIDDGTTYKLSQDGWYWYVNLMYYLSSKNEQAAINSFIREVALEKGRMVELSEISFI